MQDLSSIDKAQFQHELVAAAFHEIAATKALTPSVLSMLAAVFTPAQAQEALTLLDRKGISRLECPAGRALYQVTGSGGRQYVCLPNSNFCECQAYLFQVLRGDADMCKHVLAAKIGEQLGLCELRAISDQDYMTFLSFPTGTTLSYATPPSTSGHGGTPRSA